jgi:isoquinoline 1-oxidoreductase beta subunit
MSAIVKVTRRDFLRYAGVGSGALVLGCYITPSGALAENIFHKPLKLNNFVAMEPDGTIVITTHRPEMGQGIRSSLALVLADELGADWSRVRLRQADADGPRFAIGNPNDHGKPSYLIPEDVSQFADSSRSMALYFLPMRLLGAATRLVLTRSAAKLMRVDPEECEANQHKVVHKPTGKSLKYDLKLLLAASSVGVPQMPEITAALKKKEQWDYIGKDRARMPSADAQDMVTGKAVYGADQEVHHPGMLTAVIARCPVANGTVKSFDATAALAVPGVKYVTKVIPPDFPIPAGGVGAGFVPHAGVAVIAENTWAAMQGRRALKDKIEWDLSSPAAAANAKYDSDTFRHDLEKSTSEAGNPLRHTGDVDKVFDGVPTPVKASYYVPHLAQAPMEPPVAIALYENGSWEIWSSTQGPELTQRYVGVYMLEPNPAKWLAWQVADPAEQNNESERRAQKEFNEQLGTLLGMTQAQLVELAKDLKKKVREKIKVHMTLLGGGFGRKSKPDYAVEAAFLARQYPGVPIRVQWTREDDIKFSYFNAVSHQYLKAAVGDDGLPTALLHRSAFTSFFATIFPADGIGAVARDAFHNGGKYPYGSGIELAQGLEDNPFKVEHLRIENCPAESHIRVGWMRSVANIYHAFALCSFADEMAIAAKKDSKDYLLELLGKKDRGILDLGAESLTNFDNNGFPSFEAAGTPPVIAPYPVDVRRLRAVINEVATKSGWNERRGNLPKGHGLGIAAHRSFLSYMAVVIEVELNKDNELTINEMYGAIDCGFAVNPDRVHAQLEGGMLYGLSYALLGEITVKKGEVVQNNFDDYPVLRIHQVPKKIRTYIVNSDEKVPPTGVGEPPTPVVAPALANAIFAAGGPRINEIPFHRKVVVL